MFIKKSTRSYKGKTYTNYLLVESYRTPKGPRQKTICSLGDLKPRSRGQWLLLAHKLQSALAGQPELFDAHEDPEVQAILDKVRQQDKANKESDLGKDPASHPSLHEPVVAVRTDLVTTEEHREAGALHVGLQMWRRLGMDEVLAGQGLTKEQGTLTCAMVLNRLIKPCSERAMAKWLRTTAVSDLLDTDFTKISETPLYAQLDRLYPLRANLEREIFAKVADLFNLDDTIYLYDLTSTYFEGLAKGNPKAALGHSRDGRSGCPQVVVGLVVNRDGFPIAHEVFPGNTADTTTVARMLDLLDKRVGLKPGQTVVVDRGMSSKANLALIRERKLHYVVAARQSERNAYLEEWEHLEGFQTLDRQPSPTNPAQKKSKLQVKRVEGEEETRILCLSEERIAKDCAIRTKQESRLLIDLERCARLVGSGRLQGEAAVNQRIGRIRERYPRVARYYHIAYNAETGTFDYHCDEDKKAVAQQLDGSYVLRTSRRDLTAEEGWRIYNLLTLAENGFRCLKTQLEIRPIYHQLAHRVESHIFLSILAYSLLLAIEKTLREKGCHESWATVRETLRTHQICTVVLPTTSGACLKIRRDATPEPCHRRLYDFLQMPSQIMAPKRIWQEA